MTDSDSDEYVVGKKQIYATKELESNDIHEACENVNVEVTSLSNYDDHGKNNNNDSTNVAAGDSIRKNSLYGYGDNNADVCLICEKKVYPMEKLNADGRIYHKNCFRCSKCRCFLSVTTFSISNNTLFCKIHFMERFKMRGKYDDDQEVQIDTSAADVTHLESNDEPSELPVTDTKSLLAKFRDLETGVSVQSQSNDDVDKPRNPRYVQPSDDVVKCDDLPPDDLPPPETTKSMVAKFKAMESNKNVPSPENVRKMQEKAKVPAAAHNNIRLQTHPSVTDDIVVRNSTVNEDYENEMPELGITKNLMNRFEQS